MSTQLITALDVDTPDEALALVQRCGACTCFKVGMQLFTRSGPSLVRDLLGRDLDVFLDLKYHDIPNTVAQASRAAADLGVGLFNVHALGGRDMIAAAREAIEGTSAKLLAVTILTSASDDVVRNEIGLHETAREAVVRLAAMAVQAGAHGLVCSPQEISAVRDAVGPDALIVTPGVRPAWSSKNDQARITTPRQAKDAGADYIVVGRPITKHADPAEAVDLIVKELNT